MPCMRSMAVRTVSTSSTRIMSTRGCMTSWTDVSPMSMISWIMRFSSSSSSSLSATMSLISSSEAPWFSSQFLMPSRRARPLAEADVKDTSGEAIFWNTRRGPATVLLTRSGSASAMRLGTSSPTTMLRYDTTSVMNTGAITGAAADSQSMPKPCIHFARGSDRLVAAAAEAKKPTSVMAT